MRNYDFEHVSPRYDIGAPKWMEIKRYFPEEPKGIIPFSVADMELLPMPEIVDGLQSFIEKYPLGYGKATIPYLEAVKGWMKKRHNWDIETDWIVSTKGVINGFYEAVRAYTEPGDGVIMCTPIYYPMYSAISNNGRTLAECPLINQKDRYDIDFDLLEKLAEKPENKLFILCSPHNPGGRIWTQEELLKIGEICLKHHVVVASDEIHFDLVMPGYSHTVFAALSPEFAANSVIMTAPSKTFNLAGLETSNIIIPDSGLRQRFIKSIQESFMDARVNLLGYEACRIAYTQGEAWLDQLIGLVDRNKKLVLDFFQENLPEITCMEMMGSYLLWMDFSALGIEPERLAHILKTEAMLFFDEGFVFGKAGAGYERWNLACPTRYVAEGLERLKAVMDRHKK